MAERNQKVHDHVRQELEKDPSLGSRELYALAQKADKSLQDSLQQFHARYVLPLKREQRKAEGGEPRPRRGRPPKNRGRKAVGKSEPASSPRRPRATDASERDRVRGLLLQFAQELTDAESRSSLVQALSQVDTYVDRIADRNK